jgi:hypothetical protein
MNRPLDPRALTIDQIRWDAIGPSNPALAGVLVAARLSSLPALRGGKSWPLILRNQTMPPDVWVSSGQASSDADAPSTPVAQEFVVSARNRYGTQALLVRYRVLAQCDGAAGAPEQTIARLTFNVGQVSIAWGWTVSMRVVVRDNPGAAIALLPVNVVLELSSAVKSQEESMLHVVSPAGIGLQPAFPG